MMLFYAKKKVFDVIMEELKIGRKAKSSKI